MVDRRFTTETFPAKTFPPQTFPYLCDCRFRWMRKNVYDIFINFKSGSQIYALAHTDMPCRLAHSLQIFSEDQ